MIIRPAHPSHYGWLSSRADFSTMSHHFRGFEAVDEKGVIWGMVGLDGWTDNSAVITVAAETPIALRGLIRPTFEFVFKVANRGLLMATIRGTNDKSLALCRKIGFRETYRVKDAVRVGEDLVLFEMRREECRWIEERKAA